MSNIAELGIVGFLGVTLTLLAFGAGWLITQIAAAVGIG